MDQLKVNWERIQGNWREFEGRISETWGKLTHADLVFISGRRDRLIARLQQAYGHRKDAAEREIEEFLHAVAREEHALKVKTERERLRPSERASDPSSRESPAPRP